MHWPLSKELERLDGFAKANPLSGPDALPATFSETRRAALDNILFEERSDSSIRVWREQLENRSKAIESLGGDRDLAQLYELKGVGWFAQVGALVESLGGHQARNRVSDSRDVDAYLQQRELERAAPDIVQSDDTLRGIIVEDLKTKREENAAIMARGGGFARFIGEAQGLVSDPLVAMTLPFGPGPQVGRSMLANAARGFAGEAGVALAVEVPIQMEVARFKAEIDSPWTYAEASFNVLSATLGAGVLRGGGSITVDLAKNAVKRYRAARGIRRTDESEAAAEILQRYIDIEAENPIQAMQHNVEPAVDAPSPFIPHAEAYGKARAQAEAGQAVDVAEMVSDTNMLNPVDRAAERFTLDDVETFAPGDFQIDARRFQFKEGGDAQGITSSLAQVDTFDPSLAGQVLGWQQLDGARFIVDGHQRIGLMNRAIAGGQAPADVRISGFILKEADGVSAEDAMRIGAVRNLTASTGSALDAAKVLRGIGHAGELLLPPLPPNSALLRQGRFIARLGDDAFTATVNEIIPPRQAAIVGELIHGDAEQSATIQMLAKLKPPNEIQARAMVEQIRTTGFKKQITEDLFGERSFAESLIRERAQVLDATLKAARADKTTFSRLVSRGTEIEATGANRLDLAANQRRAQQSGQAIEAITRLANQKGEISEALNEAARAVKGGAKPAAASKSVLAAVKRAGAIGDTGGRQADAAGPAKAGDQLDPEGVPVNPIDRTLEPTAKAEALHVLGAENDELVKPVLAEIDQALGTTSKTSFKEVETIVEKSQRPSILAKRPWFQVENVRDSYRFKTVIEPDVELGAVGPALDKLLEAIPGAQVIKADTTMLFEPKQWGWRAAVFDMQMPNGQLVEWYIPIRELEDAKKAAGHALFDKWRDVDVATLTPERASAFKAALDESNALYADAWARALGRMNQTETAARASFDKALASSPVKGLKDSASDSPVMGVLPELDQASFSRTATKPSEPSTTTRPSDASIETESAIKNTSGDTITSEPLVIQGRGVPDEGSRTGYIDDTTYDDTMAQFELLEGDSGGLLELGRVTVDERGAQAVDVLPARRVIDDLDAIEDTLDDIAICARGAA